MKGSVQNCTVRLNQKLRQRFHLHYLRSFCGTFVFMNRALLLLIPTMLLAISPEQRTLLLDSAGWEYLTISDKNNGFETSHVCFDEKGGRGPCTGRLFLRGDGTFTQTVTGHGKSMDRHGTYQIDGDQMTFVDELGTKDGPYTLSINLPDSTMDIETTQAGVTMKTHLMLEREFRRRLAEQQKQQKR